MTYCVAMRLNSGLVFLSDSRTNAGVDHIGTFRKMSVFDNPGDRIMVMMTAGNLAISQSIRQMVSDYLSPDGTSIWTASSMVKRHKSSASRYVLYISEMPSHWSSSVSTSMSA